MIFLSLRAKHQRGHDIDMIFTSLGAKHQRGHGMWHDIYITEGQTPKRPWYVTWYLCHSGTNTRETMILTWYKCHSGPNTKEAMINASCDKWLCSVCHPVHFHLWNIWLSFIDSKSDMKSAWHSDTKSWFFSSCFSLFSLLDKTCFGVAILAFKPLYVHTCCHYHCPE